MATRGARALFLLSILGFSLTASANFQSDFLAKKRVAKQDNVQWTLADWLSQKNRIALMDEWLAMNRSRKWFELVLGGAGQQFSYKTDNGTTTTSANQTAQRYQADIYAWILNLNGEYQKTNNSLESSAAAAGLRLLGSNAQTTSLVVRYGERQLLNLTTLEKWQNQYAEGVLQLYIVQAFGLVGDYRYYLAANSNMGDSLTGHRASFGAFFELDMFRLFADYFQEPLQVSSGGVVTKTTSDGFEGGLRIFF